jgi:hypothetical protein
MGDFIKLPKEKLADILTKLGDERSTTLVSNVITELAHHCEHVTSHVPVIDYSLTLNDSVILLEMRGLPCVTFSGIRTLMNLYPRDIASVRCVFTNEQTMQRLETGCLHISFWRRQSTEGADNAAPPRRTPFEPIKLSRSLKRSLELNYADLNTDADDRATLEKLVESLMCCARLMPEIHISIEPIMKNSAGVDYASTHHSQPSLAPKKRSRSGNGAIARHTHVDDDATALSDNDTRAVVPNDSNHVGYCVFCANVPNLDAGFLEHIKQQFGNRVLEMVVIAPVDWIVSPERRATAASEKSITGLFTPAELAITVRRARCTEAESGQYALVGSNRLQRVIARTAKALNGTPCIVNGN